MAVAQRRTSAAAAVIAAISRELADYVCTVAA
jgi:hypothetical protein